MIHLGKCWASVLYGKIVVITSVLFYSQGRFFSTPPKILPDTCIAPGTVIHTEDAIVSMTDMASVLVVPTFQWERQANRQIK